MQVAWALRRIGSVPVPKDALVGEDWHRWMRSGPVVRRQLGAGRSVVRQLVQSTGWATWQGIQRADGGRPLLAGAPGTDVTISHSRDWVLVAIARGGRVGADVEEVTSVFGRPALRQRACTPAEAQALDRLPGPQQAAALADVWTAKEALVKASGLGLSVDLRLLGASSGTVTRIRDGTSGVSACMAFVPDEIREE
ncbi:4'-phosphopantetheinyl transferase superfamily protein [Cellulomonas sp. URHD0024]|uniref:4'-phosphopantetheinyl transferase family protein n=1 Tax=Cellulomonas sp. URHD0024 TaxID=1302620 RepID=UPI0003F641F6|nr:4'-phosphopantetheinyl transferase superfamily protein [Cellulomonas sp. URHD0024]